ncbi:hypothetical protein CC117_25865 [Parafrankia colletiae]|uniref:Helix-turn-helix domain-containing protein n=1 Tax=Parafrankia colletiae TaxID=573497 RepID=A0A1S1QH79_9ACTN|nr:hypothetical protein CC117_25865 [Parafrankia colletiae]
MLPRKGSVKTWTDAEIRHIGTVVDIVTAGEILGIGRTTSYALARQKKFPVPVIRVGGRYIVPTGPLKKLLGIDTHPTAPA